MMLAICNEALMFLHFMCRAMGSYKRRGLEMEFFIYIIESKFSEIQYEMKNRWIKVWNQLNILFFSQILSKIILTYKN